MKGNLWFDIKVSLQRAASLAFHVAVVAYDEHHFATFAYEIYPVTSNLCQK